MEPVDNAYADRMRDSFARQRAVQTFAAELVELEPGVCAVRMGYKVDFKKQDGFLHAGIVTAPAETAAGYAAFSLVLAGSYLLAVNSSRTFFPAHAKSA